MEKENNNIAGAVPVEPVLPTWEPGKKRLFPEDFRRRAVAYYDSLPDDGSKGAYLRRAGIHSSSISQWRQGQHSGVVAKPGRKPTDPVVRENVKLKSRVATLESELERANTVIDVQKKFQRCSRASPSRRREQDRNRRC